MIYEHVVNKALPVRAVEWTGNNWPEIQRFAGQDASLPSSADERFMIAIEDSHYLLVPTPFGRAKAPLGTWVVEDASGYRLVEAELFETEYLYGAALLKEVETGSEVWDDGYDEGVRDTEKAVPPLLRRFFWWEKSSLTKPWIPLYLGGADEYCNKVVGIRLKGGVLFVRTGKTIRLTPNPDCADCGGNA